MSLLDAALTWHDAGFTVVPAAADGSKRPAVNWKTHQHTPPTRDQITAWFASDTYDGLGLICGTASGNLEMLEIEGRATHLVPQLAALLADHDLEELWARLCAGYLEQSPSGGLHWLYRVTDAPAHGNTKLARRRGDTPGTVDVLIETRGQGGFTVAAPSAGRTHPTGKAWTILAGSPATVPTLTGEERDMLHAIARILDAMPAEAEPASTTAPSIPASGERTGLRPGDHYNNEATWDDILGAHGWTKTKRIGSGFGWTRPGKKPGDGISATTGTSSDGVDRLYVFSSSTEFDTEKPYSKFAAFTLLEHGGDWKAATKALAALGFGDQTPPEAPKLTIDPPTPARGPLTLVHSTDAPTDGTAALQPEQSDLSPDEDAMARALITTHGDDLRYCPERGRWLRWNGHRWQWDDAGSHRELIKALARRLPGGEGWAAFRKRALSAAGVAGVAQLAATDGRIVAPVTDLDARPYELNTPAGIVDLRTGTLSPPDPNRLHTRVTKVAPDFEADLGIFGTFLEATFPDPELRAYMARLAGLSIIGVVLENLFIFGYGVGANGKTTYYEAIAHALGLSDTGYARSVSPEILLVRRGTEHPAELAQLMGARLVIASELDDGQKFAEARLKMLTGSDTINARFMRGNPFTFAPTHTLHLLGNHKPDVAAGGPAFWRRVQLIPFTNVVAEKDRDPHLGEKLNAAAPAILAWVIRGAVDYLTNGLQVPQIVRDATRAYEASQDTVGKFVEEECHLSPGSDLVRVKTGVLRTAYERWCSEVGETPVTAKRLTNELTERFSVKPAKSNGVRWYTHITLLQHDETDPADPTLTTDETAGGALWS